MVHSLALVIERTIPPKRPSFVAKLVSTFTDNGCSVVSSSDPYGRNLDFLDRNRQFFFQVASQLYSRV
jgi:hypothetical protein